MSTKDDELGMEGLTPEERAALAAPDDDDANATQGELEDKAGGKNADDDQGKAPGRDDGGAAAADGNDGAHDGTTNGDDSHATAAGAAESVATPSQAPILIAQAPADAEAKLADLKSKKDEVITQFDDGDITAKEMQQQLDGLAKEEREIERALDKAQIATDMEQQRQKNQWDADCNSFLDKNKSAYDVDTNKDAFDHLNETVIAFAKMPRNVGLSGPELLERAHRAVMAERGTPVAEAKPGAKARAAKPELPPDLGRMPSASSNDPGEGKWASLDRLQGENPAAYEAALAKMPETERDAYLAA